MMQKILTIGVVIGSLAAWGYDVGDYVQDGLVAQYDGIRNVGAALPHDDAAQYWVNLASPSNSLEFVGQNVASGSWTANGYSFAAPLRGRLHPSSRAGLRPVIDNNRNLRLKPALQAQSSSAILRRVLKEVLASTVYAASVAMANGWRPRDCV